LKISLVIPTYQERSVIATCLCALEEQAGDFEVFVADGGSSDGTLAAVAQCVVPYPLRWGVAPVRGRSAQMNWGAAQTTGEVLLFLHADSVLSPGALRLIGETVALGGRFDLRLDCPDWPYPLIAWTINQRTRLTQCFTGDMGIFVQRAIFEQLGGFPNQALMEDLEFSRRLYHLGKVACLTLPITTSSRRWQKGGIVKTILLMQLLRTAYALGVSPNILQRWYRAVR